MPTIDGLELPEFLTAVVDREALRGALRDAFGKHQPDTIWLMTDGILKIGNDVPVRRLIADLNKDKKEPPAQNTENGHLSNRIKALEVEVAALKTKLADHKHD